MRTISTAFRNAMKAPVKQMTGVLHISDVDEITSADDLISFTVDGQAKSVGKSVLRKLTAKYLGTRNIVGTTIEVKYGVLVGTDYEFESFGKFLVTQCETDKENGTTTLTAYDKMVYSILNYQATLFTYPTTISGLLTQLSAATGIELETDDVPFGELAIEEDLYANISGTQYRNIIEDIAILGGGIAMINQNDKLEFRNIKTPTNTVDTLTYADLKKLKISDKYGEVNSLVLSRQPQEDNVILQNETSIADHGMTEIKIVNNEIIDKRREDVAADIFPYFDGTTYYPFNATTTGFGWYEAGDKILITDDEAVTRESRVMGSKVTIDGSIQETLFSDEPTKTETNYARAGGLDNRIKNTEIQVDKQQQTITSVVQDFETLEGVTNENFTSIFQNLTTIIQSVQNSGGINLLKNSAFYRTNPNGTPAIWETSGSGTFKIAASVEATANGSLSGNVITLSGIIERQTVTVVQDTNEIPEEAKTYYSFRVLVKKGIIGYAKVRIYNDVEEYIETIPNGTQAQYEEIRFEALLPKMGWYIIELSGESTSTATFTDAMLSVGKYTSAWSQANGEILNTNVNIDNSGIIVKSSVFDGDYTAITPLEFSGYSKVGGVIVKAFTLNKDQTEVKKLLVSDGMAMPPLKIVPITTGSVTGWAFVKRSA